MISFAVLGIAFGILAMIISLFVAGPRAVLLRQLAFAPFAALIAVGLAMWLGSLLIGAMRRLVVRWTSKDER